MTLENTEESYGAVSKAFHWLIGLMIIGLLGVGLWMSDLESGPFKFQIYGIHKSVGILVLMLAVLRVAWKLRQLHPRLPETMPLWQRKAADLAHAALYVVMFTMPLSGWAMSNAAGFPVSVFGLWTMPNIAPADKALRVFFVNVHEMCGYLTMALIAAHIGAALWHHFVVKDNVLRRMWPGKLP